MAASPVSIGLPGLNVGLPGLPPVSLGGGPSGATSSGVSLNPSLFNPFNFDNSNWQVNIKGSGSQSATSASGSTPAAGMNLGLIGIAVAAWFLLK
jgi:hypothetical protein